MAPLSGLVPSNANQLLEALGTCNILLVLYQRSLNDNEGYSANSSTSISHAIVLLWQRTVKTELVK